MKLHHAVSVRARVLIGLFFLLSLTVPSPGNAQATQGSIIGSVKDLSGAVVPKASVTLTSVEEGTVRTTDTNALGDYRFLDVKAGHYTVSVSAPGFAKWTLTGAALAVRQELRVDAALGLSTVQSEIKVEGDEVSTIQTETPTISDSFTAADVNSLPVNTRASFSGTSPAAIFGTLPGVQADSSDSHGFSLQGALPFELDVTVDGVTSKDATGGNFLFDAFPSTESISEVRADGALANAEFGNPAQIVVTTKGGGNTLHGSGFFYYQDSAFDAIPYTYPTTKKKASVTGKTFGTSAGGPVFIPGVYNGHNRSFFFGAYEGWRHPAQATIFEVVPTAAMKTGDFSSYSSAGFKTLMNPFTGLPYAGNKITSGISTIAQSTLKQFYPDPNTGNTSAFVDDGEPNYQANVDASGHSDQFDVRGDQYFGSNQKFLVWGKFTWKNFPINSPEILLVPSQQNTNKNRSFKIDANWSIRPNLINEFSFGFTHFTSGSTDSFDGKAWTQKQGWQGLQNLFYNGIPEMNFNNIQGLSADRLTGLNKSLTDQYTDTVIWNKGSHTFKFGLDIQTLEAITPLGFNGSDNYGTYYFNTNASTGMFTGVDFADFLLGLPNASFYDVVRQDNDGVSGHYHFFGQDEWHVSPRLTLSYGLRYELHPGYYDRYGDIGNFDPTVAKSGRVIYPQGKQALLAQSFLASANACDADGVNKTNSATVNGAPCMPVLGNSDAGFPSGLKKVPHLRFMPRVGFAWRPTANDKWAVRGGFGIYQITMLGSSFYSLTGTVQAQTTAYTNSYNPATHAIGFQWPQIYGGSGDSGGTTNYGQDYFGTANSVNWKDPYTQQWSLSLDHDFGSGYGMRASYIGSATRQLVWAPDENTLPFSSTVSAYNQPFSARLFPNWGRINTRATGANSTYESFQLEGMRRMVNGVEFHSTFTYGDANADNQGPANSGFGGEGGGQRATSILDRHADYGRVYGTRRLRWNTTGLFDLPVGRGRMLGGSMNRLEDSIIGGWRLSAILTTQTGAYVTPYFPSGQGDPSGTGSGLTSTAAGWDPSHRNQHADRVSGASLNPQGKNRLKWVNAGAFTCPGDNTWTVGHACQTGAGFDSDGNAIGNHPLPIGRFGNAPVGAVEGPGLFNLSTGLNKTFTITERVHLKAEGTFTNVLNHTNLGDPNVNLSSSSFGIVNGTIGGDFGGARTGQISARLEF
ncbi:TonB-dependent receptor [Occallatibacter savannae]|uniref:TonB-dependent receptor n=1 Tax=Occallatibacter savannae TaxID=1002691 RepID=UPI000D685BF6|nr:TonB-dependent receptor [Occallatibacter savannae]